MDMEKDPDRRVNIVSIKIYSPIQDSTDRGGRGGSNSSSNTPATSKIQPYRHPNDDLAFTCVGLPQTTTVLHEVFNDALELHMLRLHRLEFYPLPPTVLGLYRTVQYLEVKEFVPIISRLFNFAAQLTSLHKIIIGHSALCDGDFDQIPTCPSTWSPIAISYSIKRALIKVNEKFYKENEERKQCINIRVQQIASWLVNQCPRLECVEFVLPMDGIDVSMFKFKSSKFHQFGPTRRNGHGERTASPPMDPRLSEENRHTNGAPAPKRERRERERVSTKEKDEIPNGEVNGHSGEEEDACNGEVNGHSGEEEDACNGNGIDQVDEEQEQPERTPTPEQGAEDQDVGAQLQEIGGTFIREIQHQRERGSAPKPISQNTRAPGAPKPKIELIPLDDDSDDGDSGPPPQTSDADSSPKKTIGRRRVPNSPPVGNGLPRHFYDPAA